MELWTRLSQTHKPIVLYGMGNGADKIISIATARGVKISGVFASDGFVRKKLFHGMPIMSYSEAKEKLGEMVVLVAFGTSLPDVLENIRRIASEQELYVPDVPVVGDNVFDLEFAKKHEKSLRWVYSALADERSRQIYKTLVEYKLSGDPSGLYGSAGSEDELYALLSPTDNGVFADCGAFNGDTVEMYLRHVSGFKKIYAIEPDRHSFKKLAAKFGTCDGITLVNAPLSSDEHLLSFDGNGSRGSHVGGEGTEVRSAYIDGILDGQGADFIKIDVEGAEDEVLRGAEYTIRKFSPKLLVSCYHRAEDIFALPLRVLSMNGDYRMHIRHPMYLPPWDASFIFC